MSNLTRVAALLPSGTTASAPPSIASATAGAALPFYCDQATVCVQNTAGTGALTALLRLWGFNPELARWFDLGLLNGGNNIGPSDTNIMSFAQGVAGLRAFTRMHCEIEGALGGAGSPAIKVDLVCIRAEPVTVS